MAALTSLSLFPHPSLRACTDVRPCRPGDTDQSVRKWHTYEPSTNFIGLNAEGNVDTVVFGLNLDYESIKQAGGGVWRGGGGGRGAVSISPAPPPVHTARIRYLLFSTVSARIAFLLAPGVAG